MEHSIIRYRLSGGVSAEPGAGSWNRGRVRGQKRRKTRGVQKSEVRRVLVFLDLLFNQVLEIIQISFNAVGDVTAKRGHKS
jgi:hypothetical protein